MSESLKNTRNVAIILVVAAAVYLIPGGGRVASTFEAALWAAFAFAIGFLGLRMYREHHMTLYGLGDRYRGLLYGAVAMAVFLYAVRTRMWYTLQVRGRNSCRSQGGWASSCGSCWPRWWCIRWLRSTGTPAATDRFRRRLTSE